MQTIYKVKKQNHPLNATVTVPGSKSVTNRALLLAALGDEIVTVKGVLLSNDSRVFLSALTQLGYVLRVDETKKEVVIQGTKGKVPKKDASIYVGSAGTAARFLTALLGLSDGIYEVDSSEQMEKRPMKDLLIALESLGAKIEYKKEKYHFPFRIEGALKKGMQTDEIALNIDESSQYLSALLMLAPVYTKDTTITLTGKRSAKSYVEITEKMMQTFGCDVIEHVSNDVYRIKKGGKYSLTTYQVEPDVSAACYFYGMAAVLGGTMKVQHVNTQSMQGDLQFLKVLESMGCTVTWEEESIAVTGGKNGELKGISINMSDFSDQTMTLAALAPFAQGEVRIDGIGHIRKQESNRIKAICTELKRMGIQCEELENGICITPGVPKPTEIETYEDHRMAMAFTLVGLRADGICIKNPECCAKTFAEYFEIVDKLTNGGEQ